MTWQNARSPEQAAKALKAADKRRGEVRRYLTAHGMTQATFADRAGISKTTFSRFMSGTMQTGSIAFTQSARYMRVNP